VAYRQLCAVAFVMFGLAGGGCGGNTAGSASGPDTSDDAPPSADDPAPSGSDDSPPSSDDSPPSSPDTPPSSPDSPPGGGGGRIQQLCEQACELLDSLSECPDFEPPMGQDVCDSGACSMAVDPGVDIPCLNQLEGLFACVNRIPNVCMPSEQQAQVCRAEAEAFGECAEDVEPPDTDPDPVPNPNAMCGADCQDCPTPFSECVCVNPDLTPAEALEFCSQ
jgi:hypothetical protein